MSTSAAGSDKKVHHKGTKRTKKNFFVALVSLG
jgi:hypothetical protein